MLVLWLIVVNWCINSTKYERTGIGISSLPLGTIWSESWCGISGSAFLLSLSGIDSAAAVVQLCLLCLAPRNYDDLLGATWILPGPSEASWCSLSLPDRVFTCGFSGCQPGGIFTDGFSGCQPGGIFTDGYLGLPTCLGVSPMAI